MNRILLVGRLTKDPELKLSNDNMTNYVTFTLAIDRHHKSNDSTSTREVDFIPAVAFNKLAEHIHDRVTKGSLVSVSGKLRVENYTDKNGDRRYYTEVIVDEFQFVGAKRTEQEAI